MNVLLRIRATLLASTAVAVLSLQTQVWAKAGATDPIPGTSNSKSTTTSGGGGGGGGGGGKSSTTTVVTTTTVTPVANPQPLVVKTLTFTPVKAVNGSNPVCTGDYRIDPYYPTLSLMTVNAEISSANVADGTQFTVKINGVGGTIYPFTPSIISTTGGLGLVTCSAYITPGTTVTSVTISDATGAVVASGN